MSAELAVGASYCVVVERCSVVTTSSYGALKTLNVLGVLFSEFKTLKVLEFPKLALKSLAFVNVNLSSSYKYLYA